MKSFLTSSSSSSSNVTLQSKQASSFISSTSIPDTFSTSHQQSIDSVAATRSNKQESNDLQENVVVIEEQKLKNLSYWSEIDDLFKTYYSDHMARKNAMKQQSESQYAHASIKYIEWLCEKGKLNHRHYGLSFNFYILHLCVFVQIIVLKYIQYIIFVFIITSILYELLLILWIC